jgi:uncharacterized protein
MEPDLPTPADPARKMSRRWLVIALSLALGLFIGGLMMGGEMEQMAMAGAESLPLMALALLAYLGQERGWAKVVALLWLAGILLAYSVIACLLGLGVLFPDVGGDAVADPDLATWLRTALLLLGSIWCMAISIACLFRPVRVWASRFLPLNPDSFVHAVALSAVVGLALISFVPLLTTSQPAMLVLPDPNAPAADGSGGRDSWGMLRDDLYGLGWMIPASIVAVGFGLRRTLRESLYRLGLVRPTWRQVVLGLGMGLLLLVAADLLDRVVQSVWGTMAWPETDGEAVNRLFSYSLSSIGAVVVGVSAGLGEELAVRGVLQPRVGLLLSNLFFTGLHAFQYNWDALISILLIGLALGLLRKRTNTTTSALAHGSYDFLVTMGSVLQIPGFF